MNAVCYKYNDSYLLRATSNCRCLQIISTCGDTLSNEKVRKREAAQPVWGVAELVR